MASAAHDEIEDINNKQPTTTPNFHYTPSGVWNMPAPLKSSLVGLPAPGLGDTGALPRLMGVGRIEGPSDAREFVFGVPFMFGGAGEVLGLVEGGRKDILKCKSCVGRLRPL